MVLKLEGGAGVVDSDEEEVEKLLDGVGVVDSIEEK